MSETEASGLLGRGEGKGQDKDEAELNYNADTVVENIPDALIAVDSEGFVTSWNRFAVELFGWPAEEAVGVHIDKLVRTASGKDKASYRTVVSGSIIRGLECMRQGKNSVEKRVMFSAAPVVVNGVNRGAVLVYADLSERDSLLESLIEAETIFKAITDSNEDAVIIMDGKSRISFFNTSAELMFGYAESEAVGRKLHRLIAPEPYWEMIEMGFAGFRKTGRGMMPGRVVEIEGRRKNGSLFPVELSVSSFYLNGEWRAVGILRDISDRKRIEAELIEAREAALNAARIKSEFLTNMSHEIRTPLNAIIGTSDLLTQTDLSSTQKNYMRINRNASKHLLHIINDVLDISKVEAGKIELEQIPFDIFEELEKTCGIMAFQAHEKGLDINCRIRPNTPRWVEGDPSRLKQVLINLVGNAIKFTSSGEVTIDVRPERPGRVAISVTDTGIGIPEDKVEAIFKSFTQGDSSHTRKYGGTGLGLAICTKLVSLMGGEIFVKSEVGSGSTFSFTCRLPESDPSAVSESVQPWPVDLSGKQILVADDSVYSRVVLKELLESWGASVDFAESAESVLKLVADKEYDAIFLDFTLDGTEVCKIVDSMVVSPMNAEADGVVIMLQTTEGSSTVERCKAHGVDRFLYKPPARSDLAIQLSGIFRGTTAIDENINASADVAGSVEKTDLSVLLAEDSPDNIFLMKKYMESFPWEITVAENGREAVYHFLKKKYDIILMDMQMPIMDGYEATRSIRAHEHISMSGHTPIAALTAHTLEEEVKKCLDAGCDIHIAKPVRKKDLISKLDELMRIVVPEGDKLLHEVPETDAGKNSAL